MLKAAETRTYYVNFGLPKIVVQDTFSLDAPEQVIVSNSGAYMLHVFKDRYRVFDAQTSALIIERAGVNPKFSPTSRYLTAAVGSKDARGKAEHEVIDLFSGEVIAHMQSFVLGWANGDTFLVTALGDWRRLSAAASGVG